MLQIARCLVVLAAAAALLDQVLASVKNGSARRSPQDERKASSCPARTPQDGEIHWAHPAAEIRNSIRACAGGAGAYTYLGERKCIIRAARAVSAAANAVPGAVLSVKPLTIAAGGGVLEVESGEVENGVFMSGAQLAEEANIVPGMRFGPRAGARYQAAKKKRVLILGADGFIGNALSEQLLSSGKYEVHGMDLRSNYLGSLIGKPGFHFEEGDISIHREWLEYHIRKCDIVVPLVAIATPIEYTRNPLRVFELDFEENLRVVRYCVKYGKRIIFPSTSEVYGMCDEGEFDEDNSKLVLGPIRMQRWIYSCSKQLLDRVIWAYGQSAGLRFTLFRPFNWIGPKLDSLTSARIGSSRAITQLILNLVEGSPILLIDGGEQKRCFTDISDGIEALYRIIENDGERCDGQIINIGNPENEASIRELAEMLVAMFERHPLRDKFPPFAGFRETESGAYYGKGYQDVQHRRPSIRNAQRFIDWTPKVSMQTSVEQTLDFFLRQAVESGEFDIRAHPAQP